MVDEALSLTSLQRAILFSATSAAADKQEAKAYGKHKVNNEHGHSIHFRSLLAS